MPKKYDALTKSKITSGLQCHKKLWFDIHQPIKKDKAAFRIGNLFGDHVKKNYAKGNGKVSVELAVFLFFVDNSFKKFIV